MLLRLGVLQGDRVATLCWNTQAHMECWYGIMGMGAACHTLNPRLTAEQIAWMLGQSEAEILIVSADLATLASKVVEQATHIRKILVIDPEQADLPRMFCRQLSSWKSCSRTMMMTHPGGRFRKRPPAASVSRRVRRVIRKA